MKHLRIVVCVKVTPKPEEIRVDPRTGLLERANVRSEINPPDMNALEMAMTLKYLYGGRVEILSMGPPFFEPYLRVGLAMGADHIFLLSDRAFAGADTLATTYVLATAIERIGEVDLVICGEESSDGATGQVPPGLAEWLNANLITLASSLMVQPEEGIVMGTREFGGGYERLEAKMPCVISVKSACNEPRFMDFGRKSWAFEEGRVTLWTAADLRADPAHIGLPGSPTVVSGLEEAKTRQRRRIFLEGTPETVARQVASLLRE